VASRFIGFIFKIQSCENYVDFFLFSRRRGLRLIKLKKSIERSKTSDRCVYYITGGILAHKFTLNGRLEFRYVPATKSFIFALINFRPSLPWFIYKYTQAIFHLFVMSQFIKYLKKMPKQKKCA
jgi:hypothetical protein